MTTRSYAAFIFDMDGTIVDSLIVAERVWGTWATRQGLDVAAFLPTIHGVRAVETIRRLAIPGLDVAAETAWIAQAELIDIDGIRSMAGAAAFLAALPPERWAIATSASRELATRRMAAAGLPLPRVLVSAEDVANGKPAPDCFQLAAARMGYDVRDCLVFEDAPAGIAGAEAAGTDVMVVVGHHAHAGLSHPSIAGYDEVHTQIGPDGLTLHRR